MSQPFHIHLRKKFNRTVQNLLKKIFIKEAKREAIKANNIQNILIVRVNYRIGNIIFNTPLINALSQTFPDAKIDMMIGAPFISPLIEGMPNIRKVYSFNRELLKHPLKILSLRRQINRNNYDIMLFPSPLSTSDGLMSWVLKSTYKIGFYDKDSFKSLTHQIDPSKEIVHEALKPLKLMELLGIKNIQKFDQFLNINLTKEERENPKFQNPSKTIGIFRDARGKKKIEDSWWQELIDELKELDSSLNFLDILDPNNQKPLNQTIEYYSEKNLRAVATKISNLTAFICADTGPMHLASSTLTPTIALFKSTSPALYGTLGEDDLSLIIQQKRVKEIAHEIIEHLNSTHHQ